MISNANATKYCQWIDRYCVTISTNYLKRTTILTQLLLINWLYWFLVDQLDKKVKFNA